MYRSNVCFRMERFIFFTLKRICVNTREAIRASNQVRQRRTQCYINLICPCGCLIQPAFSITSCTPAYLARHSILVGSDQQLELLEDLLMYLYAYFSGQTRDPGHQLFRHVTTATKVNFRTITRHLFFGKTEVTFVLYRSGT
jgi:hypothetical protein